jgi:hypothetical protein
MAVPKVYDEVIDFIAAGSTPGRVAAFRPSKAARARVAELLAGEQEHSLSGEEASELQHYLELEHLMRLAKARARRHLPRSGAG